MIQARVRVPRGPVYLLDQIDRRFQVHAEIDEGPNNTLALVLFLLEHEHMMIEVLLQLLVGEVDAQLLEAVVLHRSLFMHHAAHRHTAKRERERKIAREREMRMKTQKQKTRCEQDTVRVQNRTIPRLILKLLAAQSEGWWQSSGRDFKINRKRKPIKKFYFVMCVDVT